jgi:hypothetical protein
VSYVDNVILSFSRVEPEVATETGRDYEIMDTINAWLLGVTGQQFGPDIGGRSDCYGGRKYLETPLYVAAFNYLPETDFVAFLRTLPWREPQHAQLLIKRQHEDRFEIIPVGAPEKPTG